MAKKKTAAQLDREIDASIAREGGRAVGRLLTTNAIIIVESDGDRDVMTWGDFADANREMPELVDVADEVRRRGRATLGGGAAPLTTIRLAD